jgi:hypothetical protein
MEYMLMLYFNEQGWPTLTQAEQEAGMAAHNAYRDSLEQAGILRGANALQPSSRTATVRLADGEARVVDGPFAEAKEQIGGYYIIEVVDRDAAVAWAARCPTASYGAIEVRPLGFPSQNCSGRK